MNITSVLRARGVGVGKKLVGNAQPSEVLAGKTFSNADGNDKVGTMPNNGALSYTPGPSAHTIPAGYTSGGSVAAVANLSAGNVRYNSTVGGVAGTFSQTANGATPDQILAGRQGAVNGVMVTGTMTDRGSPTLTPGASAVSIPAGRYTGGQVAAVSNLSAGNVRHNSTVGGVAGTFSQTASGATAAQILSGRQGAVNGTMVTGTMPDRAGDTAALATAVAGNTLRLRASEGYRDGTNDWVTVTDNDWLPQHILEGKDIFGKTGTLAPLKEASGDTTAFMDTTAGDYVVEVLGLAFKPKVIYIYQRSGDISPLSKFLWIEGKTFDVAYWGYGANNGQSTIQAGTYGISGYPGTHVSNGSFKLKVQTYGIGNSANRGFSWHAIG